MHEASLVRTLLAKVAAVCLEHQGDSVTEVCVELGPLSGVEPLLVQSAFEQLAPEHGMVTAKLVITEIPLEAKCRDCGAVFEIQKFRFRCEICESPSIQVVRGDEFRLLNVTIRQSADQEATA